MKVYVADRLDPGALQRLRDAGHEVISGAGLQGAELGAAIEGCAALIVRGATRVTADVLLQARGLRVVVRAGTGLDNVDTIAARDLGIEVRNTPAANAVSVAELTFALLLALERQVVAKASALAKGQWLKSGAEGRELAGRRIGLVGFGRIGREVAVRARAFAMEACAYDPALGHWPAGFEWVKRVTLDELLAGSDVVSLHVPLTLETQNLINRDSLTRMKPGAVLVNCARGGVVDDDALLEALRSGHLAGAALDVFAIEPPGAHALLSLPNVVATPHLGASTREAQRRAGEEAAALVIQALARRD